MAMPGKGIFVVGAKRTPFCKYGGSLREMPSSHVFAAAARDAIQSAKLDPTAIDNTIVGNVNFLSQCDGGKTPRYCGLYSGVPIDKPALGINKACGSGLQAVITGALEIITGVAKISLTGGTELMSSLPQLVRNVRFGTALGTSHQMEDHIKMQFPDSHAGSTLQKMAEDLAKKYDVTRENADRYALESNLKWKAARESKVFEKELATVTATIKKKEIVVNEDEITHPNINAEDMAALPTVLENGFVITAGNSSAPADGAAALLLAGEDTIKHQQLQPLARIIGWACVGTDPQETGLGAVPAVKDLLNVSKVNVNDVDLFEINDTFASQALISAKLLNIDINKINVNGGAVVLGHPVAATGARLAVHLIHELRRRNLRRGIAASSCGGGQGIAVLLEAIH